MGEEVSSPRRRRSFSLKQQQKQIQLTQQQQQQQIQQQRRPSHSHVVPPSPPEEPPAIMTMMDYDQDEPSFSQIDNVFGDVDVDKILSMEDDNEDPNDNSRFNAPSKPRKRSSKDPSGVQPPRRTSSNRASHKSPTRRRSSKSHAAATAAAPAVGSSSKGREKALKILGTSVKDALQQKTPSRSRSQSRATSRTRSDSQRRRSSGAGADGSVSSSKQGSHASQEPKRRKSKMEKIEQLQAKNALYKEEFKRVQRDKRHLKKDIEAKKQEVASLSKEIDTYIAETTLLKSQLSEALQQLDKDETGDVDGETADELAMELSKTRAELEMAVQRVRELQPQLDALQAAVAERDAQIETLQEQVEQQAMQLREAQMETEHLRENIKEAAGGHADDDKALLDENERLQEELTSTLERAAAMVKEREDAIADLLKENDEMRELVASQATAAAAAATPSEGQDNEELARLREEIIHINKALEETQDRNIYLEEEVENWIRRGGEMERDIARLQDELDVLERRASAAESNLETANTRNEYVSRELEQSQNDLAAVQEKHQELVTELTNKHHKQVSDMAAKHKSALLEAKSRYAEELEKERMREEKNGEGEKVDQSEMLRRAMAGMKPPPTDGNRSSWFGLRANKSGSEDTADLDENQRRIKELEELNEKQEEEIKQLKSEFVRAKSAYNETIYVNKKKIEELTQENAAYAAKIASLEIELESTK